MLRRDGDARFMNANEIMRMAFLEKDHWWYRGLRDLIHRTVLAKPMRAHPRILDAGCGTGENLRFLHRLCQPSYIGGFDVSSLAVELCHQGLADAEIYQSDVRDPEIRDDDLDLVLSCDVIIIPGIQNCQNGLQRLVAALRSGGRLILNLPAYQWLYSEHDAAVGTRQRITAGAVRQLLRDLGMEVELVTYRLCSLFPAVVAARLPSMLQWESPTDPTSDLTPARPWVNEMLTGILSAENWAVSRGLRLPWGSSVFAVGRKP